MKFGIGQPMRRYEDLRLITGRGRYTDDVVLPRMSHAFVLRSPVAHAQIKRIDTQAARRMPGVLFVAAGEDVRADGLGDVPCTVPLTNRDGTPRHDTPRPVLAFGKVRHVGQPVALVVAETLVAARDAAEAIEVEYDGLPAVTEAKDAIAAGAPQLFDRIPGNVVFDWDNDMGDAKATEAAFAKAARVVTLEVLNTRVVVNSMEPRNAIAEYDPASGRSTLHTATQGPHFVRDPLAEIVLKLPKDKLRLITPNVGGGFGMKAFVYPEHALVVWASRKIGRPVKWQEDRSEGFVSDNQGASSACASLSSPTSVLISHRSGASCRRVRPISCPAFTRSGRFTSTSRACAPILCRSAPIAAPDGPRPRICSSASSTPRRASSA
jgi:carbon-monoxide dehydrogenase large subunit